MFSYDLNFIVNHRKQLKEASDRIRKELPILWEPEQFESTIPVFGQYRGTGNDIKALFKSKRAYTISYNLTELANKLNHMMSYGYNDSIMPMLTRIAENRQKKFKGWEIHGNHEYSGNDPDHYRPFGHFRIGTTGYVLTDREVERVKEYFNL